MTITLPISLEELSMAHDGSNLFQIRRIFGFPAAPADAKGAVPALHIAAMAVHTLEKKQLLALAVAEEFPRPVVSSRARATR